MSKIKKGFKPLSSVRYFTSNKRRSFGMALALSSGIIAVLVFQIIQFAIFESSKMSSINQFEKMSFVYPSSDGKVDKSVIDMLSSDTEIERNVPITMLVTDYFHFFGNHKINIQLMGKENVDLYMQKTGIFLKEGEMPAEGKNELAIDYRVLKNRGLKVGDYIGRDLDSKEDIAGKYKITGSLDGNFMGGFGIVDSSKLDLSNGFAVYPKVGYLDSVNKKLDTVTKDKADTIIYDEILTHFNNSNQSLKNISSIITVAVLFVISFAVANTCYAQYYSRRTEFGMLLAIGYKRIDILKKAANELIFINSVSFVTGITLSVSIGFLLKFIVFDPKGIPFILIGANGILQAISIPIVTMAFGLIPSSLILSKIDPIVIIDKFE